MNLEKVKTNQLSLASNTARGPFKGRSTQYMSSLNFKTACFAYRGERNVPFCFTIVFAIVLHRGAVVQPVTYVAVSRLSLVGIFLVGSSQRPSLGEQIDECVRSAEIMVKKGDRRHIWYDVGIPCQI